MISASGIYTDIAPGDYFADPCPLPSLTQSIAKVLLEKSPRHAQLAHPRLCEKIGGEEIEEYSAAKAIGNAAHAALIGRSRRVVEGNYINFRTGEARDWRDHCFAKGEIPILRDHYIRAREMVAAASHQLERTEHRNAFRLGSGEVVIAWQEDGIWLRTMIDWLREDRLCVYDYKTTGLSVAPHVVVDRPSVEGWDIQAAMHERALDAVHPAGSGRRKFFYVNQENTEPYALTVLEISESDLHFGRRKLELALGIWRECMSTTQWPLYEPATVLSRPRPWTEGRWLERELEYEERAKHSRFTIESLMGG